MNLRLVKRVIIFGGASLAVFQIAQIALLSLVVTKVW